MGAHRCAGWRPQELLVALFSSSSSFPGSVCVCVAPRVFFFSVDSMPPAQWGAKDGLLSLFQLILLLLGV